MTDTFQHELDVALNLARSGAARVLELAPRARAAVREKPDDLGPVTEADIAVNELLVAGLRAAFPDDGIVAEESDSHTQRRQRTWFVDPIDGTKEFIAGREDHAVMIGLVVDGIPTVGVVAQPEVGLVLCGVVGHGATAHTAGGDTPLQVDALDDPGESTIMRSRSHPSVEVTATMERAGIGAAVHMGSVGVKLGQIARQRAQVYVNLSGRSSLWDAAGPAAILEAAGGRVTDAWGDPIDYMGTDTFLSRGIVATNGPMHDIVLSALGPWRDAR